MSKVAMPRGIGLTKQEFVMPGPNHDKVLNKGMSRPKPHILQERHEKWDHHATLLQKSVFILTYQGKMVTLKQTNTLTGTVRYPNTVLTTQKTAQNLVDKLNRAYSTTDYSYQEIKTGK